MIKHVKKLVKSPLFSGSVLMIGGSMGVNVVNYLYHLVMGQVLGPVDYGKLAAIFSILYVATVIPTSSSIAIVKFVSSAKNKKERDLFYFRIKRLYAWIGLILSILWIAFSGLVSDFLHIDEIVAILLVAPTLFLSLVVLVNQSLAQGVLKFKGVVVPNLISAIFKLIVGLGLVYMGYSVGGAMFGVVIGVFLAYVYSIRFTKVLNVKKIEKGTLDLRPFVKYALPVLTQAMAFTSLFTVDLILVKHFLPEFDAGLYAALSTLGKIIYFASQPVSSVMFPIVAGKRSRGEGYRKVFYLSFVMTALLSLIVVLFYYLLPEIAIGVLYGKEYLMAKSELVWMGVFMSAYALSYLLVSFILSLNKTKIVILPIIVAVLQVLLIVRYHNSLRQVLQINTLMTLALLAMLVIYLGWNEAKKYVTRRT